MGGELFRRCPLSYLHNPEVQYILKAFPMWERGSTPQGCLSKETHCFRSRMEWMDAEMAEAKHEANEDAFKRFEKKHPPKG